MLFKVILIVELITSILLIGSVLLQHGKGADAGASFGGGSANAVFGPRGGATFLSRLTAILTAIFFTLAILMAAMATQKHTPTTNIGVKQETQQNSETGQTQAPAAPVVPE